MGTVKVGIREFRDNLASYLLQSETPVAITRHGDTVGFFLPVRRKRTDADRDALREAVAQVHKMMAERGITEDDVVEDFKKLRAEERKSGTLK
jgi:PHD/YefM family antitoxin component YafN of YafNO toxin-antitoxin module